MYGATVYLTLWWAKDLHYCKTERIASVKAIIPLGSIVKLEEFGSTDISHISTETLFSVLFSLQLNFSLNALLSGILHINEFIA